jgi:tetratricopeptide (TPR) repeat protein
MYSLSIHADPKSADCYFNRGNAYRNLGRYEEAIQDYNRALSLSPKDVGAHVKKGVAYSFLKGDKFLLKAISCFTKAVALQPDCSEAFVRRGFAYKDLHDHEHALEDFNTCIRLGSGPNSKPKYVAEAFAGRAEILVREGRLLTALKDIERAIELNPKKYGT